MSLAEVQNKTVSWEELQQLAGARNAAKKIYYAHKISYDEVNVNADLEESRLRSEFCAAESTYQAALKKYQEQTK